LKTFKDNLDQQWQLCLTVPKVRKIRQKIGLDLLHPDHHLQVLTSLTDRLTYVFLLCEDQAKELKISPDEFEERLQGPGFCDEASKALLEECSDFFRKFDQEMMAKLTEENLKIMQKAKGKQAQLIDSGELDSMIEQASKEIQGEAMPSAENDGSGSTS
jgi:hypothetical protein